VTSRLSLLRSRLARLRRARGALCAVSAWSPLVTTITLALLGVLAIDWLFNLPVSQRLVVMLLAGGAVTWGFWRFTRPLLGFRESEIDVVLLVERQHEIDSDLVAAIQFERSGSETWGSLQLSDAVVEYVALAAPRINVFQGLSTEQFWKRLAALVAGLAMAASLAALAPGHLAAFANRLCLGSQHYPTWTRIDQIVIGDTVVLSSDEHESAPLTAKAAQGQPLEFFVLCSGRLPASAVVAISPASGAGAGTRVELKHVTLSDQSSAAVVRLEQAIGARPGERGRLAVFTGELGRLHEDVTYQVIAGDAQTDSALVRMIPLPIVELKMTSVPPAYAVGRAAQIDSAGRQPALLEGSAVNLVVECTNRKPLRSAWLTLQTATANLRIDLVPLDDQRLRWSLPAEMAALTNVRRELRYEVQATDSDGLSPQIPVRGTIRIRPDLPPSGVATLVHRVVLPTAEPVVTFRATDDYGVARLALVVDVERVVTKTAAPLAAEASASVANENVVAADEPRVASLAAETHRYAIPITKEPLSGERLPASGTYAFSLSPLGLAKGDRLKLALEVTDYRGENSAGQAAGVPVLSDALVLEVSDESGVLAAITEADQRSEAQLSEIIKRQLGIGKEP
jgi:hypothetical protein